MEPTVLAECKIIPTENPKVRIPARKPFETRNSKKRFKIIILKKKKKLDYKFYLLVKFFSSEMSELS